jgi:hypothetical protein
MNWGRVLTGGVAAGIVIFFADFVMHGLIMAETYRRYTGVFTQTQASPLWFLLIALCIWCASALLFARTRASWEPGARGGLTFGLFLGLAVFFRDFYDALVIDGMPYYLVWCWGGISMIDCLLGGAVLGAIIKRE